MRDYDAHLEATYGPDLDGEDAEAEAVLFDDDADYDDGLFYCGDTWCDGHASPNQKCDQPPYTGGHA